MARLANRVLARISLMLLRIVVAFAGYLAVQYAVYAFTQSSVWAAGAGAVATLPLYWIFSQFTPADPQGAVRQFRVPRLRRLLVWAFALLPIWIAGQAIAIWIYETWPSAATAYQEHDEALSSVPAIAAIVLTLVLAPVAEELLVRGILYRELRRSARLPVMTAAVISALVFAVMHGNAVQFGAVLLLGVFLALAFERTGSIIVAIVLHGLFNVLAYFTPASVVAPFAEPLVVLALVAVAVAELATLAYMPRVAGRLF